jgi:hypothetical protein
MAKKTCKTKAVTTRKTIPPAPSPQYPAIQQTATGQLLQMAVDKNLDVDKLERLIEMKNKEEDRAAKKDFDFHFGEMQSQFPTVLKTKKAKDREGSLLYKFCPLENITKVLGPIIKDHGFSFWFSSEMVEGKENEMRIFCHISGWGHEKVNHIDFPVIPLTKATNKIQERGAAETYGQRYAFKAGFGFVIAGEDDDARVPEPEYQEPRKVGDKPVDAKLAQLRLDFNALYTKIKKNSKFTIAEREQIMKGAKAYENDYDALLGFYDDWNAAYKDRTK